VYRLTERAEDVFPKSYDTLANHLLAALKSQLGQTFAERLCVSAAQEMAGSAISGGRDVPLRQRLSEFVSGLNSDADMYNVEDGEEGFFLHQYACPFFRVAKEHREVCVLHQQYLRRSLGAELSLVSCLLDGDLRCSYLLREAQAGSSEDTTADRVAVLD
jgi:predicted ArsR family transcriptional regulator